MAHELGHALGLKSKSECSEISTVMSPSVEMANLSKVEPVWSDCSKTDLTTFLAQNKDCMMDSVKGTKVPNTYTENYTDLEEVFFLPFGCCFQDLLESVAFQSWMGSKQCGAGETVLNVTGYQPVPNCRTVQCIDSNGTKIRPPNFVGPLLGTPCILPGARKGVCQDWVCADKAAPDLCPKCLEEDDSTVKIIVDIVEKMTSIINQLKKLFGFL